MNLFNMRLPAARAGALAGDSTVTVTIYHNPACSTSRQALARLRDAGHQPRVIEYLKTPPSPSELLTLLKALGMKPREILRKSGTPYEALGLGDPAIGDAGILAAIDAHPSLIQRPIVVTEKGARICRPLEAMDEVLPG